MCIKTPRITLTLTVHSAFGVSPEQSFTFCCMYNPDSEKVATLCKTWIKTERNHLQTSCVHVFLSPCANVLCTIMCSTEWWTSPQSVEQAETGAGWKVKRPLKPLRLIPSQSRMSATNLMIIPPMLSRHFSQKHRSHLHDRKRGGNVSGPLGCMSGNREGL